MPQQRQQVLEDHGHADVVDRGVGQRLGPYAEEELRQALQISNGDLGGLVDPISVVLYTIIALVLLFPLLRRLLPRKAHVPVLDEVVHEVEEAHAHHGATTAVAVERRVPRRTYRGPALPSRRTPGAGRERRALVLERDP